MKRELSDFFQIASREAAAEGKEVFYKAEFVEAWQRFADTPSFERAVGMIERAPEYASLVWAYIIECCPGGGLQLRDSLLRRVNATKD